MRLAAALVMLLLPCVAGDGVTGAEEARIRLLVEQFRSGDPARRQAAREHLQVYGERIVPFLQTLRSDDPEVVRALRSMTRGARKLKLVLVAPAEPHRLGAPFRATLRLVNDSDHTYLVPLLAGAEPGAGSPFTLVVEDREVPLRASQVEAPAMAGQEGWGRPLPHAGPAILLAPGVQVRLDATMEGEDVPLRRPGTSSLRATYSHGFVSVWTGVSAPSGQNSQTALTLASDAVEVRATGRKAAELEAMLESGDPARAAAARAEVRIREDPEVLAVLRRRAGDPELLLAAVRRLGAAGQEEDFPFLYRCTRDPELEVRRAAVAALASYRTRKARSRLISLAQDHEMKLDAIRALRSHRHPATIDCFVRLLVLQHEEPAVAQEMLDALYEWTDRLVEYRASELRSFERWWMANRAEWVRNDPGPR